MVRRLSLTPLPFLPRPSQVADLAHSSPTPRLLRAQLGQEAILSVPGPMARSLASCTYFAKIVFGLAAKYDATALPFKFDEAAFDAVKKHDKLSFGVIRTDLVVTPTPPVKRALDLAVQKLRDAGHEGASTLSLSSARLDKHLLIVLSVSQCSSSTGPTSPTPGRSPASCTTPCVLLFLIIFLTLASQHLLTHSHLARLQDGGEDFRRTLGAIDEPLIECLISNPDGLRTTYEVWQINRTKEALQQAFLDRWMASKAQTATGRPFDGLLCPAAPIPAPRPLGNKHVGYTACVLSLSLPLVLSPCASYADDDPTARSMFNLLDAPCTVFPVCAVDPAVDTPDSAFKALTDVDQQIHDECASSSSRFPAATSLCLAQADEEPEPRSQSTRA